MPHVNLPGSVSLYYEFHTPTRQPDYSKPSLLLVAPSWCDVSHLAPYIAEFKRDYSVCAIEMRGQGRSINPVAAHFDFFVSAADLAALKLAILFPDQVLSLSLAGLCNVFSLPRHLKAFEEVDDNWHSPPDESMWLECLDAVGNFLLGDLEGLEKEWDAVLPPLARHYNPYKARNIWMSTKPCQRNQRVDPERLGKITQPTLLIQGADDLCFPAEDVKETADHFTASKDMRFHIEEGGPHLLAISHASTIIPRIRAFLSDHPSFPSTVVPLDSRRALALAAEIAGDPKIALRNPHAPDSFSLLDADEIAAGEAYLEKMLRQEAQCKLDLPMCFEKDDWEPEYAQRNEPRPMSVTSLGDGVGVTVHTERSQTTDSSRTDNGTGTCVYVDAQAPAPVAEDDEDDVPPPLPSKLRFLRKLFGALQIVLNARPGRFRVRFICPNDCANAPVCFEYSHTPPQPATTSSASSSGASLVEAGGNRRDSEARDGRASRASQLDETSYGVLNGTVGGLYSPFPQSFSPRRNSVPLSHRTSSCIGLDPPNLPYSASSHIPDSPSSASSAFDLHPSSTTHSIPRLEGFAASRSGSTTPMWGAWEKEADDFLHSYDPELEKVMDKQRSARFSWFALLNTASLVIVVVVLVGLFAGWPIYRFAIDGSWASYAQQVVTNSTGQVPRIPNLPSLIDETTPSDAYERVGLDGENYELVFSDEFNTDGRTFWPGDDPYWEAVDLHYWGTRDLQWYDPDAITTRDGNLVITMTQQPWRDLNFRSGMLQSWNKFCFTGGYLEGFWPGIWTLGNLGRAGYGGTNDGVWPYTYDSCDVGTMPNQTWANRTGPDAARNSGSRDYGGELSWLTGQRLSACTCEEDRDEHPGPSVSKGRGAPEIDALEGSIWPTGDRFSASQSVQIAPFTSGYLWPNTTPHVELSPDWTIRQNQWRGSIYQESISHEVMADNTSFGGRGYTSYGFEYDPGPDGEIRWALNGSSTVTVRSSAMGPDAAAGISQRPIAEEPMSIVLNLGISYSFQQPEWGKIRFPGELLIDYVRVYQKGKANVGCDPKDYPTSKYIADHPEIYNNANISTFDQSPYRRPRNRLSTGGCS
ncbi:hypothetical protein Rhopal_000774-T1 [Rhodotorula paludigena]|uniref:GH16 domain-containing protein n=1 Tax=Rhodotorula paludigena TaxID=86838 RepID=A0AAV5GBK8_9BASI|nr:hypothetical protein Rhopal_000774-T1 [Rhodotorula paludigena]